MSFNVTQCPACESTFNTNSRVLAAAAGKVRCGACLNVFEAIDNFLLPEESEATLDRDESVFVGNDPQEFFDPSSFLTRSALTETHADNPAITDTVDEQDLHEALEQAPTVSEEFFASVTEELQGRENTEAATASIPQEYTPPLEQPEDSFADSDVESIDLEFEENILKSFIALDESTEDEAADTSPDEAVTPAIETAMPVEDELPLQSKNSILNTGLSASFTFGPYTSRLPQTREAEPESPPAESSSAAQPVTSSLSSDIETNFDTSDAELFSASEEDTPEQGSPEVLHPEEAAGDSDTTESPSTLETPQTYRDQEVTEAPAQADEIDAASAIADSIEENESENASDSELLPEFKADAVEQGSTEALYPEETHINSEAAGHPSTIQAPQTPTEQDVTEEPARLEEVDAEETITGSAEEIGSHASEADATTPAQHKEDELTETSVDSNEKAGIESPPVIAQDTDDESTEAIRARALEAELNDDEALEAIPKENLIALGSMSTPVELLARKESRLLRSTLLFLSILLLAGLLGAQYLWQRMDLYSQLAQLRPFYAFGCEYLNCELPEYKELDAIRSENLSVQTHPSFDNGLMVYTVIRNTAAFEQPFPILILSFNSAANSVIALREFTSAEYLDPGLRSVQSIPAMTPVQISLAIMDPGPDAVNYTLAFRWP